MVISDSGWAKLFHDSIINGSDKAVDSNQVSWRKTTLENIIGGEVRQVTTSGNVLLGSILGPGEYWQSDDLIANLKMQATINGKRIARRIERKLQPGDSFLYIHSDPRCVAIEVTRVLKTNSTERPIAILDSWLNQWLIVEIDIINNAVKWYLSKDLI